MQEFEEIKSSSNTSHIALKIKYDALICLVMQESIQQMKDLQDRGLKMDVF